MLVGLVPSSWVGRQWHSWLLGPIFPAFSAAQAGSARRQLPELLCYSMPQAILYPQRSYIGTEVKWPMSTRSALVRALLVVLTISFSLAAADADARRRRRRRRRKTAKKQVVMLPFKGSKASTVRSRVIRKIKKRVRFVSYKKYRRMASRLKVNPSDPDGMVAICAELRCQAVVAGKVKRRGSRYTVTVTVYDASSGDVIGRSKRRARGSRRLKRTGTSLGSPVLKLVRKGSAPPRAPPPEEQPPPPAAEPPPPEEQPEEVPPLLASEDAERVMDKLDERGRGRRRQYEGHLRRVCRHRPIVAQIHADWRRSGPGSRVRRRHVPRDRSRRGDLPVCLLHGQLCQEHRPVDQLCPPSGSQHRFAGQPESPSRLQLRRDSRHLFAAAPARPQAALDPPLWLEARGHGRIRLGFREFGLGPNDVLPSFNWQFIRFGASGRLPFGTPLIAFEGGFDLRMLLKAGQEAVDALGERSGGLGWSAHAGLRGDFSFGLFYFAMFEYQAYSADFKGLASEDMVRDCFPDRTDATSGSDGYLRFWAGAGYAM